MTPQFVLEKSLCRAPHCAGPHDKPFSAWSSEEVESYRRRAQSEIECMDYCAEYGEPGYDNPEKGILFANWNHFSRGACDLLEKMGYSIEWSDEWVIDYETSKAYRTSPDCYSWQPYYWVQDDGEIVGGDLIETEDIWRDEYVEYLTNNPRHCNTFKIDFEALGFRQHNGEFETGWHPGQNDDPQAVYEALKDKYDVVFDARDGQSQFYVSWRVWIKDKETA